MGVLVFALFFAAASEPVDTDTPTVGASLDRTEAHVGDRLTLTISAVAKSGITVTLPKELSLGKLEILDRETTDKLGRDLGDGRRSHKFVLGLSAYEVGELEVPPIAITWKSVSGEEHTMTTDPLQLTIQALVADDEPKPEVQPLKPPRSAMVEDKRIKAALKWGGIGLGSLLLLYVAWRVAARLMRKRHVAQVEAEAAAGPKRPPDEVAMEKLRALRAAGNFSHLEYRPFYFAVAEVVRAYLGARYGFDSLELTTSELLDQLQLKAQHLCEPNGDVVRFLNDSDMVKFAKTGSTDAAALAALDAAQAIVLSTAAPLEEVAKAISGPVRLPREDSTVG
jgi:hypothetical protein